MNLFYKQHFPILFVLTSFIGMSVLSNAQTDSKSIWKEITEKQIVHTTEQTIKPSKFRLLRLDVQAMKSLLQTAPLEKAERNSDLGIEIHLPMPDGSFSRFRIYETYVMHPDLAAKFPEIKTYAGQGIDDVNATIRLDVTPFGFHSMVLSPNGSVFIDPYSPNSTSDYICYYKKDLQPSSRFICELRTNNDVDNYRDIIPQELYAQRTSGTQLRTYRLALAATGEYTATKGGTVSGALAGMTTSMNRVNGVYETEVAIRMVMVANDNLIVYTNSSTDPYTNSNGSTMLGQNQTTCDGVIGSANYDIGHVFSTGGGGVAYLGCVCNNSNKAGGVTGSPSPVGDAYDIDYVAHEMGHQFGGNHSFNSVTGSCGGGNRSSGSAYEPGSGITVMAYAGICGTDDLAAHSIAYFHTKSFDELVIYSTTSTGNTCAVTTSTGNTAPVVTSMGSPSSIPISTPFVLTGAATDGNSDPLTFSWEQFDLGASSTWNATQTAGSTWPLFRPFSPTVSPSRTFPQLSDIINNTTTVGEVLPTVARTLHFRLTARDNRSGGGGVMHPDTTLNITVVNNGGAFAVSAPNTAVSWTGNSTQTVTWTVNGTTASPINCANVKISLSTDGGNTFPTVILASTVNDGTENITVPNIATTQARIKVEAVGNIFFDMSNVNFTITTSPTLSTITTSALAFASICAGSAASVTFTANGIANAGNTFTAQLSDSGGSFASPVSIGTLSSINAGTINVTIPGGSIPGTKYRIRVVSSNPAVTGSDNGTNFSIFGVPAAAGSITGTATVCKNQIGATYSVPAIANATGYTWTLPTGGSITAGSNTNSITVSYSAIAASGNVTVLGFNTGCNGTVSPNFSVTVNQNVLAGTVSGTSPLCINAAATFSSNGTSGGNWSSTNTAVATVNAGGLVTAVSAGTTNITYTISSGCGSPVSSISTLTVSPNVTAGIISGTSPLCIGATATFSSNGTSGGNWTSTNSAVATVNAATGLVTAVSAGTTTLTYAFSSGCGSPVSSISTLTVSPNVTAGTVSGTSPLCIGATATYSTNGTSGGNWASTNTAVATVNAATGLVTAATAGTTNITYTVGSGCGSPVSSSKTLTVSPNVTAGTVSGTSPLCIGATATYTSTGTSGGSWSSTNTFVATVNAATGLVTTASAGSTNITYTVSSGCGSPVSSNSNLIVSPNVTAGTVSGTTPLCAGTTATYNSNGTSGGNWASTNTAVATVNASTGLVTAGTAGTTNITYTVSSGCGSPASSLKTLTVSTNVTAGTVSGTSPLCIGATATYSSTGTSGGSWSSSNTFVATVNAVTGLVTAASAGSTNITYTINSGCGSPASSTKSLTVSLNVTSGTVSGTSPLCIGATATYSSNGTSGGNWSSTNPSVATVNAASGLVTPVSAGTTGITYTVSSGCASPVSSNKVLTVSPPVTAGTVSGTSPLCIGTTALYSSDGTSGGSWTSTNTAVATVNASTGLVTAVSAGTTNISYTLSSGCGSPVFSIYTLTVDPGVTPGNVSGTSLLCIGATATYSSDGTSGGSWSSTNTAVAAVTAGAGLATAVSAGTTNITYTVSSGCGSPVSSISKLTVISLPDDAGSIAGKSTVCRGETGVAYSVATIANATGYSWTLPTGASITGGTNTNSITVSFSAIAASGNITVTGTNECGNGAASTNLAVTVNPLPDAAGSITGSVAVCQNETGVTYSVPPIANATGYTWTLPAGATITDGVNTNSITVSYSSSASSGNSTVTGTNACGNGTTSSTFAITVNDPPVISNFTPVSGVVGSSVAINGSHFNTVTSVLFNGVSASFVIDNDNRITATVPAGATTGLISVTNPCGTSNSSTSFIVTASTSITLNLRIFLEGFYRGNSSMAAVADPSGHPGICDTISVVLHTATPPYEFVAKVTSVVDTSGNGIFVFTALPSGFYYIGVIHRSSVETWSKNAVFFDLPSVSYDFTSPF